MMDGYISAQEAGVRLGVTTGRIYQMARTGELEAARCGRALLIMRDAVEEELRRRGQSDGSRE